MATKSPLDTVHEQMLESLQQTQQFVLDAVDAWRSAFASIVPEKLTLSSFPAFEGLPKPAEAIDSTCAFAQDLLASQREFARKLLVLPEPIAPARPARAAKSA